MTEQPENSRPAKDHAKVPVSLRLDADLVRRMKATGEGWERRAEMALVACFYVEMSDPSSTPPKSKLKVVSADSVQLEKPPAKPDAP